METRPVDKTSAPYNGPGAYPSGAPTGDQYRPSQSEYSRPSKPDDYSRVSKPEDYSRPSKPEDYSRPSKPEDPSRQSRPEDYPRPSKPEDYSRPSRAAAEDYYRPSRPDDYPRPSDQYSRPPQPGTPSAPYSNYGPPPPIPAVAVQPPIEQMAGPAAYPTPHSQHGTMAEVPKPATALNPLTTTTQDLKSLKTSTQFALREYLSLQRKRGRLDGATSLDLENQIQAQGRIVLGDLKTLRKEVGVVIKEGENHRWRNWLIGGAVATFIPAVKRIFRRSTADKGTSMATNNTEYAFSRSKALLERIKDSVLGRNSFASIAFFVFAVLYVFSNEVSLLVAKTVSKRLKRLSAKIERGDIEVVDSDMQYLEGWRWRVLMWGREDPALGAMLSGNSLDFNDPLAVSQLNKTLLKTKFGLEVDFPHDRLAPGVPQRHRYILWLKELMDSTTYDDPDRKVVGLDIGTGASCIYPLLGCTQRRWSFFATDIDDKSISYAKRNIDRNNLQNRISVVARRPEDNLVPLDELGADTLDFVMTNPPFYKSEEEAEICASKKADPKKSAFTMAPNEQFTSGGELGFVGRILEDSLVLRERVQWYTAMFGMKSSFETFIGRLREHKIDNYAVTEFVQGQHTRRWAVAWSFGSMRPSDKAARGLAAAQWKGVLPPSVETEVIGFSLDGGVAREADKVHELMASLELISWEWDREKLVGLGKAREDVWSRAWRRKKMREEREGKTVDRTGSEECRFAFEISLSVARDGISVHCRWRQGDSFSVYQSFCGFLKTRLADLPTLGK
ncbi:hypothetical protein CkaCkLH20_02061 [Colletotrichum karsti]|uniref:Uncharacterized protein n=1 Tax=Colletotrichum karsti TaxID=1095194 RepID=A0A9P6IB04_9PEZI|nr:uncharacterized protein CkaCkLH20_02061 [Colletotrichum karsti]KAF9880107.1 hypothetical protein CkaCkLH20_02061 [Colletotrichum karsti]